MDRMSFDRINDLDNPVWASGARASALDVECPLCGAAPDMQCRFVRASYSGVPRPIKRPHHERVIARRARFAIA